MSKKKVITKTDKRIGERIKALREEAGLNQTEFAKRFHYGQGDISLIEKGEKSISYDALLSIAEHFCVTTDYFIKENGVKRDNLDLQFVCDYTGLSEKAIEKLHTKSFFTNIDLDGLDADMHHSFAEYLDTFVYKKNQIIINPADIDKQFEKLSEKHNGDTDKILEEIREIREQKNSEDTEKLKEKILTEYLTATDSFICSDYFDEILSSLISLRDTNDTVKAIISIKDNQKVIENLDDDDLYQLYLYLGVINIANEKDLALFKAQNNVLDFLKSYIDFTLEDISESCKVEEYISKLNEERQ